MTKWLDEQMKQHALKNAIEGKKEPYIHRDPTHNASGTKVRDLKAEREKHNAKIRAQREAMKKQ